MDILSSHVDKYVPLLKSNNIKITIHGTSVTFSPVIGNISTLYAGNELNVLPVLVHVGLVKSNGLYIITDLSHDILVTILHDGNHIIAKIVNSMSARSGRPLKHISISNIRSNYDDNTMGFIHQHILYKYYCQQCSIEDIISIFTNVENKIDPVEIFRPSLKLMDLLTANPDIDINTLLLTENTTITSDNKYCHCCKQDKKNTILCNTCSNILCESCLAYKVLINSTILYDGDTIVRCNNGLCITEYQCESCSTSFNISDLPSGIQAIFNITKDKLEKTHGIDISYEELIYDGKKSPNNMIISKLGIVDINSTIYKFNIVITKPVIRSNNLSTFIESVQYYKHIVDKNDNYFIINSDDLTRKYIVILNNKGKTEVDKFINNYKEQYKILYTIICHTDIWGKGVVEKRLIISCCKRMISIVITNDKTIGDIIHTLTSDGNLRYIAPTIDIYSIKYNDDLYDTFIADYSTIKSNHGSSYKDTYQILKDSNNYTYSIIIGNIDGIFDFLSAEKEDCYLVNKLFIASDLWNNLQLSLIKRIIRKCCIFGIYVLFQQYSDTIIQHLYTDKNIASIPLLLELR